MKWIFAQSMTVILGLTCLPAAYAKSQWYVTYGVGIVRPELHSEALINNNSGASSPYNQDTYTKDVNDSSALLFEVGKRWTISKAGLKALSLGLQYQYILPTDVGDDVLQYSSPEFLNYQYNLNMSANILLLNAKVDLFAWKKITPFIHVGAGVLRLMANGYSESPLTGVTARISPDFKGNANYSLTYQAGAGLTWEMSKIFSASLNYIYQPLTHFSTKSGKETWSNAKLDFGNMYAHSLFITVNYLFAE